jgi:uncharacterized membrane protein
LPALGSDTRQRVAAAALGAMLFAASFGLLHAVSSGSYQIIDTPTYKRYGDAVVDAGQVPYRDFSLEYPPGALPAFLVPSLAPSAHYRTTFEILMAFCGIAAACLVAVALGGAGASPRRLYAAAVLVGITPLVLGSVILTRFDLWPAALTIGALAAFANGRNRLGFGVLAVAASAKIYPAVILPVALVFTARRSSRRESLVGLGIFAAVLAAVLLPFAILSPGGLGESLTRQLGRPLQIESLGAAALLAAHQIGSYEPTVVSSSGSQNLVGQVPDALETVSTAFQIILLVGVWLAYLGQRDAAADRNRFLAVCAATVAVFLTFGKVLSPQFLIWLIPLVPLVAGRRGLAAAGLFLAALVLTRLWFPKRYFDLVAFDVYPTWLLVVRDVVLVLLAAVVATVMARRSERSRSP